MKGIRAIENLPSEFGYLIVFSNMDDCSRYIQKRQYGRGKQRYFQIIGISSMDVWEIADRYGMDVLIDVNEEINSKCFMYTHKEGRLKAVVLAGGYGN